MTARTTKRLFPIPPATISFHARAVVHPAGPPGTDSLSLSPALARLVPAERLADCRIVELFPEHQFVTYGIGVPLPKLRDPAAARARIPVA